MKYLDITTEEKANALSTLEMEREKYPNKKWKNKDGTLFEFCGLQYKLQKKSKLFALKAPRSLGVMSKSLDFFKVWIFGQIQKF